MNNNLVSYINNKSSHRKLNTRQIRQRKSKIEENGSLQMLTCYDYQTAMLLEEVGIDMILVGDSVGNVVLGYETTVEVTLEEMTVFASAVKRGAPDTFVIADLPFGSYATKSQGIKNACHLFQKSRVEALKIEGAENYKLKLIERLIAIGIPVMGHIGLTPQSVHEQGGYYIHGKSKREGEELLTAAINLEAAGVFAIVLECITSNVAAEISATISIPTIGIGSGDKVDGEVLVINDLLKMGSGNMPKFCIPIADLYNYRKELISKYLDERRSKKR